MLSRIPKPTHDYKKKPKPEGKPGWHEARFVEAPGKVLMYCLECKRPMWLPPSKTRMYQRCGPECQKVGRARIRESRRRECSTCGKIFYPRRTQTRAGVGRFCSPKCNTAAREALQSEAVQKRAGERWRALKETGGITFHSGPDNIRWKGGPLAYRARYIASGQSAAALRLRRKNNPEQRKEYAHRRAHGRMSKLPAGTIKRIGEAQGWRCAICRRGIKRKYHADHIMPLARGGPHVPQNIQLLCVSCNCRKHDKDPIVYMQSLGRLL